MLDLTAPVPPCNLIDSNISVNCSGRLDVSLLSALMVDCGSVRTAEDVRGRASVACKSLSPLGLGVFSFMLGF